MIVIACGQLLIHHMLIASTLDDLLLDVVCGWDKTNQA